MSLDTYRAPFKYSADKKISTDSGIPIDQAHIAHYRVAAEDATAESDTAIMATTALGATAASVTTGFTNPSVPRNVKVDGSASNMTGNVKVYGTNFAGDAINETIALTGSTAAAGNLAFKTITKVDLPARTNTPAKQKATVAVTAGASAAGDSVLTFTAAALGDDSPKDITVTLTADDNTTAEVATKIVAALNADEDFAAHFVAAAADANITIESKVYAAQDATLNLTVKTAGGPNITLGSIDVDTVGGVAEDKVSVGIGKKFGIPYKLAADEQVILKLFGNAADSGTVTADADELEKNVITLSGTPDGANQIDLYIVV
jgi:hypothetical protein